MLRCFHIYYAPFILEQSIKECYQHRLRELLPEDAFEAYIRKRIDEFSHILAVLLLRRRKDNKKNPNCQAIRIISSLVSLGLLVRRCSRSCKDCQSSLRCRIDSEYLPCLYVPPPVR